MNVRICLFSKNRFITGIYKKIKKISVFKEYKTNKKLFVMR